MSKNNLLSRVKNGKIIEGYESIKDLYEFEIISYDVLHNTAKWYMNNIGAGATMEKNLRLVELDNSKKVWLVDIVDNDFEEKVADWIFDENGNTLLCYPEPKEFKRILIEIDRKHGLDEWGEPIKKEKTKTKISAHI